MPTISPEWVTTRAALEALGVSRPVLLKLMDSGQISYRKVGSGWTWLSRSDVERIARESVHNAPATHHA